MRRILRQDSGVAIVELALILPMLLFMVFVALEFASNLRVQQRLVVFSREASNMAFRRCAESTDIAEVRTCLQTVAGEISTQANTILPGLNFVLNVYRLSPSDCDLANGGCTPEVAFDPPPNPSKYDKDDFFTGGGTLNVLLNENRVVASAEVFFNYQPLIPMVGEIFYPGGAALYDTTLF